MITLCTVLCTVLGAILCLSLALLSPIAAGLAADRLPAHKAMLAIFLLNVGSTVLFFVGVLETAELAIRAWRAIR